MSSTTFPESKARPHALSSLSREDGVPPPPMPHLPQLVEISAGIEESDELPAAQHELVERVLRLLADAARVDHQQHLDVVVDFLSVQADALHRVIAAQLADEHLRLHRLAAGHGTGRHAEH